MTHSNNLLQSLVPISQFNKGQASRIFDRLHTEPQIVVLKNNQPSAVILSPEEYSRLMEIEEDYMLLMEAKERLAKPSSEYVPMDKVLSDLKISEEELEDESEVDIE